MEYQKFIPEGWQSTNEEVDLNFIKNALNVGQIVEGFVESCDNNYNLHVKLGSNLNGIIPRNEVDIINNDENGFCKINLCKNKVNTFVQFKVKKIDENDNIILSRKNVQSDAISWIKEELKPGMVLNGIVKNIRQFGVFVEIGGGIVGLLHIEDISISRMKTPEERFNIGQKINVMIKSIDRETGRVILSYKELLGNWDDNVKDFEEKQVVEGIVKETDKYKNGIFVELKPNLVGLAEYKDGFTYGQKVKVYIKKIIKDKKKIKLLIV